MKRIMKRVFTLLAAVLVLASMSVTALAAGTVTYDGDAKKFIFESGLIESVEKPRAKDAKSRLQEYLQALHEQPPVYESVKEGKDNAPTFRCKATACGQSATGEGKSKKTAEQQAAQRLLQKLENKKSKK